MTKQKIAVGAKTLFLMEFASASVNYVSPGPVNDGGGLHSSELFLYDSIHCSLIGRVLVLLLECGCCLGAQLGWLQARTESRDLLLLGMIERSWKT